VCDEQEVNDLFEFKFIICSPQQRAAAQLSYFCLWRIVCVVVCLLRCALSSAAVLLCDSAASLLCAALCDPRSIYPSADSSSAAFCAASLYCSVLRCSALLCVVSLCSAALCCLLLCCSAALLSAALRHGVICVRTYTQYA
jgi:hypothetical protein